MRALLREDRSDDELAQALAAAGLYVERIPATDDLTERLRNRFGDLAVVDPRLLPRSVQPDRRSAPVESSESAGGAQPIESSPLEELSYRRLAALLDRLDGGTLPELYATAMAQSERGLLRLALDRTRSLSAAADLLGIHRNTLVRRLDGLGLRQRDDTRADDPAAGRGAGGRGRRRDDAPRTGDRDTKRAARETAAGTRVASDRKATGAVAGKRAAPRTAASGPKTARGPRRDRSAT